MKRSEVIAELEGMLLEHRAELIGLTDFYLSEDLKSEDAWREIAVLKEAIRYLEESEKLGVDS